MVTLKLWTCLILILPVLSFAERKGPKAVSKDGTHQAGQPVAGQPGQPIDKPGQPVGEPGQPGDESGWLGGGDGGVQNPFCDTKDARAKDLLKAINSNIKKSTPNDKDAARVLGQVLQCNFVGLQAAMGECLKCFLRPNEKGCEAKKNQSREDAIKEGRACFEKGSGALWDAAMKRSFQDKYEEGEK